MKIKRLGVLLALGVALACENSALEPVGTDINLQTSGVVVGRVAGHGSTAFHPENLNASNQDINIAAVLREDGSVTGHVTIVGGASGLVAEEVPPHGTIDFWCVNFVDRVLNIPNFRISLYIRDVGDGKNSFDEISLGAGQGFTCAASPTPADPFIPLSEGNFRTTS